MQSSVPSAAAAAAPDRQATGRPARRRPCRIEISLRSPEQACLSSPSDPFLPKNESSALRILFAFASLPALRTVLYGRAAVSAKGLGTFIPVASALERHSAPPSIC